MYQSKRGRLTKTKFMVVAGMMVLAMIGAAQYRPSMQVDSRQAVLMEKRTVVVDPGHGGVDGGAVGIHGEIEKDINLAIALQLRELLEFNGFEVIMTRETDISIHDSSADTISQKKVSDLKNRTALVNSYPEAILVSIHQNKFSDSKYSGAQMFYGVLNEESSLLAECVQTSIVEKLQPENTRQIKEGTNAVYLLMNVELPMILVECGFLSNEEEAALLSTQEYQRQMAFAIFCGIIEYYQGESTAQASLKAS